MPRFQRALTFQPFEECFAVIRWWLNPGLKNESLSSHFPCCLGEGVTAWPRTGGSELILSQVVAEISEDLTAIAGLGAEQQKVRVN